MDKKEFKQIFNGVAKLSNFSTAHGGWYRNLGTIMMVLSLQKSNFASYFELNIKLFLIDDPSGQLQASKGQVKGESGDIFLRQPNKYRPAFDLDDPMGLNERRAALEAMFAGTIDAIAKDCITPDGMFRLRDSGILFLLPNIEARLKAS